MSIKGFMDQNGQVQKYDYTALDNIPENEDSGLTLEAKQALMSCFQNVAWVNENGQSYYNHLYNALFGDLIVESITAVFTQGSATIYDTDSFDALKQYLVVTANYSDSSTVTVTDYTLSGTLTEGTSTITVSYGGKTDSFTVTVSHAQRNTTAEIIRENYVLAHFTTTPYYKDQSSTNGGVTKIYDMDAPTTVLYPAGIIPTLSTVLTDAPASLYILDGDDTVINFVSVAQKTGNKYNRWAQLADGDLTEYSQQWEVAEYSKIQFSVDMRYLDDAYMYDKTTGQVWFAGVNTPYYGMSNISEASS